MRLNGASLNKEDSHRGQGSSEGLSLTGSKHPPGEEDSQEAEEATKVALDLASSAERALT